MVHRLRLALALACLLAISGCGGGSSGSHTPAPPPASRPPSPPGGASPTGASRFSRIFLVVLENKRYADVIGSASMPYLNELADRYAVAANYFANTHPSIGNYFMMTTGKIVTNDPFFPGTVADDNLVRQLIAGGKSWKAYIENLPSAGYTGGGIFPYSKDHNPFAFFTDVAGNPAQASNLVPFTAFSPDLNSGNLPAFAYIQPNQYDNMHECPPGTTAPCGLAPKLQYGDNWLRANIAPILSSGAFTGDSLLIITFDESSRDDVANGGGQVATILISPKVKAGFRSGTFFQHQSLLRLMVEGLGLPGLPGASASAPSMAEFFN